MSLKDYQIGDTIIESKPFVHTLREEKKTIICDNCFGRIAKNERNFKIECTVCLQMYYCSHECKLSDKKTHQKECHIFKKYYFPYLKHHFYRLILRSYLIVINDNSIQSEEHHLYDGNKRSFDGLETHSSEIRSDGNRFKLFQYISETLYHLSQEFGFELNYQLLYELFCRIFINYFDIISFKETRSEPIGSGLYIKAAVLNHSCQPNAATIYFGSTLVLKAIKNIKTGEEITICYVDLEVDRFRRQNWLKKFFYFDCLCLKCQSNDFDIDFKGLDQIKKEIKRELKVISPDWLIVSRLSDAMIKTYHQIYGGFHPQMIPVLIDILSFKYQYKWEDREELSTFVSDVRQRVELMFGFDHEIYRSFINCVEKKVFHSF